MKVTFAGTRGSIPTVTKETHKYGGNTPCVMVNDDQHVLILDAGSGIRALNETGMLDQFDEIHILLTHLHMDHIQGSSEEALLGLWLRYGSLNTSSLAACGAYRCSVIVFTFLIFPKPIQPRLKTLHRPTGKHECTDCTRARNIISFENRKIKVKQHE